MQQSRSASATRGSAGRDGPWRTGAGRLTAGACSAFVRTGMLATLLLANLGPAQEASIRQNVTGTLSPAPNEAAPDPAVADLLPEAEGPPDALDLHETLQAVVRDMALGRAFPEDLPPEVLEEAARQVEGIPDLTPEQRASVSNHLARAVERLGTAAQVRARAQGFKEATASASDEEGRLLRELAAQSLSVRPERPIDEPLDQLLERVARTEVELREAQQEKFALDSEPKRRSDRRADVARLRVELQNRIDRVREELSNRGDPGLPESVRQAQRVADLADMVYYQAEERLYEAELGSIEATSEVLRLRRDLAAGEVARLERRLRALREEATRRRLEQAAVEAADAEAQKALAAAQLSSAVEEVARTNAEIAQRRAEVVRLLSRAERDLARSQAELKRIDDAFSALRRRVQSVEAMGFTGNYALGVLLRRANIALPIPRSVHRDVEERLTEITEGQLELIELFDRQHDPQQERNEIARLERTMPSDLSPGEQEDFRVTVVDLLRTRRELTANLRGDIDAYIGVMVAANETDRALGEVSRRFRDYIRERVLWIRSAEPLQPGVLLGEVRKLVEAAWSPALIEAFKPLATDASAHPVLHALFALAWGVLVGFQRRFKRRLESAGRRVAQAFTLTLRPSVEAMVYTLLVTLPLPLLLCFAAWRLDGAANPGELTAHAAAALRRLAVLAAVLIFYRQCCRPFGLAEAHFGWDRGNVALLRAQLRWAVWIFLPLAMSAYLFEGEFMAGVTNRPLFIAGLIAVGVFAQRLLSDRSGLRFRSGRPHSATRHHVALKPRGARIVIFLLLGALAVTSMLGYHYTARVLWDSLYQSLLMVVLYVPVRAFVLLWTRIHLRGLALTRARAQAEAEATAGARQRVAAAESVDLAQLDQSEPLERSVAQTGRLLNFAFAFVLAFGMFSVWDDAIPAFRTLDQKVAWYRDSARPLGGEGVPHSPGVVPGSAGASSVAADGGTGETEGTGTSGGGDGSVEGAAASGSGGGRAENGGLPPAGDGEAGRLPTRAFVSVADLVYAVLAGLIALVAARNIPGFVDMTFLQRARYSQGERYAVKTLLGYLLALAGIIVVTQMLGLSWSKIQWLAAGVSVGIGFGLQEIFANFVSGLILLFEQPIRIGDIVTVGEVSGVVSKIRMRATSIRDWDNKELVIPNKDLATGKFVNWTLSDSILRITIPVGLGYGSDIGVAQKVLLDAARNHPDVLEDPPPTAYFEGFGASSLDFMVRAHVGDLSDRVRVRHQLHVAILEGLREAGVEIAFPQRDLHLRSVPPEFITRADAKRESERNGRQGQHVDEGPAPPGPGGPRLD